MAKEESYTERFSEPLSIETDPEEIERIAERLEDLKELDLG